jgi:hypothetical protein
MTKRPRGAMPGWEPANEFQKAVLADALERLNSTSVKARCRAPRGVFYDLRPDGFSRGITYIKYPPMRCLRGGHLVPPRLGAAPSTT